MARRGRKRHGRTFAHLTRRHGPGSHVKTRAEPDRRVVREGLVPPASSRFVSLDPVSPIIVRSGRPLNSHSDADRARFPPPSTIAGCLRTAWARQTGRQFDSNLKGFAVAGPLLMRVGGQTLVPKPANARYVGEGRERRCVAAVPHPFDDGCGADLPDGLMPVQLFDGEQEKPVLGPDWWLIDDLQRFRNDEVVELRDLCRNGWNSAGAEDRRTHVTINPKTGRAEEGRLFETEGLVLDTEGAAFRSCWNRMPSTGRAGVDARSVSPPESQPGMKLLARFDKPLGKSLVHLGGKRRMAAMRPESRAAWPTIPNDVPERSADLGGLCLTLVTPGLFRHGFRPGWLGHDLTGTPPVEPRIKLRLCAAAVERWEAHSGWDLARKEPKPTRKVAPRGSTYWFRILGEPDQAAIRAMWLASICDARQDRLDGFGLALPSPWQPPQ